MVRDVYARRIVMPAVVGLNVSDAQILLKNEGLRTTRVRFVESYEPENSVVTQDPDKGKLVDLHELVTLTVSKRSWTRYLPTVYQTNGEMKPSGEHNFLREFLWIFQHLFEGITRRIDKIHTYFHPLETPSEFLPWLASWLALALDEGWSDIKKRKVIKQATALYAKRGTTSGLRQMLKIFADVDATVRENRWPYKGFRIGVTSIVGIDSVILPAMNLADCFMVHVPIGYHEIADPLLIKIHRIIEREKPAHTQHCLRLVEGVEVEAVLGYFRIGVDSYIGVRHQQHVEKTGITEEDLQ